MRDTNISGDLTVLVLLLGSLLFLLVLWSQVLSCEQSAQLSVFHVPFYCQCTIL